MKRVTTRTKHFCAHCHKAIAPKSEACKERRVIVYDGVFCGAVTSYYHPKCSYARKRQAERFKQFKINCQHPEKFQETEYDYSLPGSINGDRCGLCNTLH